jgi:hypothetical protein
MVARANRLLGDAEWNLLLLSELPSQAKCLVEVGGGDSAIRAVLKQQVAGRKIYGVRQSAAADNQHLDGIFDMDPDQDIPLARGTVDALLYNDLLCRLDDPLSVLRRHRPWLGPAGFMLCSVPKPVSTDDRQGRSLGYAALIKLLLDAGYAPEFLHTVPEPHPNDPATAGMVGRAQQAWHSQQVTFADGRSAISATHNRSSVTGP